MGRILVKFYVLEWIGTEKWDGTEKASHADLYLYGAAPSAPRCCPAYDQWGPSGDPVVLRRCPATPRRCPADAQWGPRGAPTGPPPKPHLALTGPPSLPRLRPVESSRVTAAPGRAPAGPQWPSPIVCPIKMCAIWLGPIGGFLPLPPPRPVECSMGPPWEPRQIAGWVYGSSSPAKTAGFHI